MDPGMHEEQFSHCKAVHILKQFLEVSTTASFLGRRGRMNIYFVMQQERFFSTEAEISVNNEMYPASQMAGLI